MIRRALAVCAVAVLGMLFAPSVAVAETHSIPIAGYTYQPASMTVRAGDVVSWTNQDEAPHDVVGTAFRSPMLSIGQSWSFTFTAPGTYDYYCSVHPDMRARIVVLPEETPQPAPVVPAPAPPQPTAVTSSTALSSTAPASTAASSTAASSTAASSTIADAAVVPTQATPAPPKPGLDPMLLLAGLVAAVTTLSLLLIGSRPDNA